MSERPAFWRTDEKLRRVWWQCSGYDPTAEQLAAHLAPYRSKLVAGGERGGKSRSAGEELFIWVALSDPSDELYWIVGPDYEQTHAEFLVLLDALAKTPLLNTKSVSQPKQGAWSLSTTPFDIEVMTRTSAEVQTIAGRAPAGILMVEAAQQTQLAYLRCRGRVAEKRGPLWISGTFEGSFGWYPELWQRWQAVNLDGGRSFSLPTWSNLAIFPGGRQDSEILSLEGTFTEDQFLERYGATPCPPKTLVFKEFQHLTHVKPCPYDAERPVQLWVDPGYAGAYAVLAVQRKDWEVWVIDEVYERGVVVQDMITRAKAREWWSKVNRIVMDVAGTQHQGMESHSEAWHRITGLPVYPQGVGIADGIMRVRTFLMDPETKKPRLFHDPKCKGTLSEYGLYRYNEVKENRPEREEPVDANNHSCKALAYGLVNMFGLVVPHKLPKVTLTQKRGY